MALKEEPNDGESAVDSKLEPVQDTETQTHPEQRQKTDEELLAQDKLLDDLRAHHYSRKKGLGNPCNFEVARQHCLS